MCIVLSCGVIICYVAIENQYTVSQLMKPRIQKRFMYMIHIWVTMSKHNQDHLSAFWIYGREKQYCYLTKAV